MSSEMKERMNEIRNIENKYGLMLFGMGLSHLVDTGHKHFTDSYVEVGIKQITAQGEADKANGVHPGRLGEQQSAFCSATSPVMSVEFQCAILLCANALSKFSIWTLFAYIKKYVEVSAL